MPRKTVPISSFWKPPKEVKKALRRGERKAKAASAAIVAAVIAAGCASPPKYEWRAEDTRREIIYAAALAADTYTTAHFRDDPRARESLGIARSIYGARPDPESVLVTSIVSGVAHWLVARRLGHRLRPYWQITFASAHGLTAADNCRMLDVGC